MKTFLLVLTFAASTALLTGCLEDHHQGDGHDHSHDHHPGDGHQH